VDLVASNPPYVPETDGPGLQREVRDFEPPLALFGGANGLDYYRRLVAESPRVLRPGGWLIVEFGIRQAGPVQAMLGKNWRETRVVDDLAGLPRVLASRYCP
jgi:release factor glutamine methyltransferase